MGKSKLYLLVGYPGAGKTTVAKWIHESTGAVHLWADQIRRERFGTPNYSHEENLELYEHLNELTSESLRSGNSVIFDTNFNFFKDRQHLRQIAAEHEAETVLLWINTPQDIAKQRATSTHHEPHSRILGTMSEADFERIAANLEPPAKDENPIKIDGTKLDSQAVKQQLGL